MEWNGEYERALIAQLARGSEFPSGAASTFIPLVEDVGVKLFPSSSWRNFARAKQAAVYAKGFAPEAGGIVDLSESFRQHQELQWKGPFGDGCVRWGYLTRRAKISPCYEPVAKQAVVLALKSDASLLTPRDLEEQDENFGLIDGRVVYIDFDHGSWNVQLDYPC